jgi:hypothetical protein
LRAWTRGIDVAVRQLAVGGFPVTGDLVVRGPDSPEETDHGAA